MQSRGFQSGSCQEECLTGPRELLYCTFAHVLACAIRRTNQGHLLVKLLDQCMPLNRYKRCFTDPLIISSRV